MSSLQTLRRFAREKSELLRRNVLNWNALGQTRVKLIEAQSETSRLAALAEERESQRRTLEAELVKARSEASKMAADMAQMSHDFEEARTQSLQILKEAQDERDGSREEAKKQAEMCDALNTRIGELVSEGETLRKEKERLQKSLAEEHNAMLGWQLKCQGTSSSLVSFFTLSSCFANLA